MSREYFDFRCSYRRLTEDHVLANVANFENLAEPVI